MHYPYRIDSVLLELLLYKGSVSLLIFDDLGLPSWLHLRKQTSLSYILHKCKVNDFPRHRVLKYEKIISSNCKFFSHRICTAKSKPDRSLNHWAAMAITLLNIKRLADIAACLLLSILESEEDASEDVGDWMIRPYQASVSDGETGYENRPPGRPVSTRFLHRKCGWKSLQVSSCRWAAHGAFSGSWRCRSTAPTLSNIPLDRTSRWGAR